MKKPSPKMVRAKSAAHVKKTMRIEEADNGGFISRTEHHATRKPGDPWEEPKEEKNVHSSVTALASHIRRTFPPKASSRTSARSQPQWAGVANNMLGKS